MSSPLKPRHSIQVPGTSKQNHDMNNLRSSTLGALNKSASLKRSSSILARSQSLTETKSQRRCWRPQQTAIGTTALQFIQWLEIVCSIFLTILLYENNLIKTYAWSLVLLILPRFLKILRHLKNRSYIPAILSVFFCDYLAIYIQAVKLRNQNIELEADDKAAREAIEKTIQTKTKDVSKQITRMHKQHLESFKQQPTMNLSVKHPKIFASDQAKSSMKLDVPTGQTQIGTTNPNIVDSIVIITMSEIEIEPTLRTEPSQGVPTIHSDRTPQQTETRKLTWQETKKEWEDRKKRRLEQPKTLADFKAMLISSTVLIPGISDEKIESYYLDRKLNLVGERIMDGLLFTAPSLLTCSPTLQLVIYDSPFYMMQVIYLTFVVIVSISICLLANLQLLVYRQHANFTRIQIISFIKSLSVILPTIASLSYLWGLCFRSATVLLVIEGAFTLIIIVVSYIKFNKVFRQTILDDESHIGLFIRISSILVGIVFSYLLVFVSVLIPADQNLLTDGLDELQDFLQKQQPNIEELGKVKEKLSVLKSVLFVSHIYILFRFAVLMLLELFILQNKNYLVQPQENRFIGEIVLFSLSGIACIGILLLLSSYNKFFKQVKAQFQAYLEELKEIQVKLTKSLALEQYQYDFLKKTLLDVQEQVHSIEAEKNDIKLVLADYVTQETKISQMISSFGAQNNSLKTELNKLRDIAVLKNQAKEILVQLAVKLNDLAPLEEKAQSELLDQNKKLEAVQKQFNHFKASTKFK